MTRMAALTKKAPLSATTESMMLKRMPARMPGGVCAMRRDCTSAECR